MNNNITIQDLFGLNFLSDGLGLGGDDPRLIAARLINVALGFLGIITVLMFLSAGARWMLSGGDEEKIRQARGSMIGTIIGLIIILSANSIVLFLINNLTVK
ncbi:MAG: hypothetical protein WA057_02100 [Candidatus Magasanikiibacteriota bacterium]